MWLFGFLIIIIVETPNMSQVRADSWIKDFIKNLCVAIYYAVDPWK